MPSDLHPFPDVWGWYFFKNICFFLFISNPAVYCVSCRIVSYVFLFFYFIFILHTLVKRSKKRSVKMKYPASRVSTFFCTLTIVQAPAIKSHISLSGRTKNFLNDLNLLLSPVNGRRGERSKFCNLQMILLKRLPVRIRNLEMPDYLPPRWIDVDGKPKTVVNRQMAENCILTANTKWLAKEVCWTINTRINRWRSFNVKCFKSKHDNHALKYCSAATEKRNRPVPYYFYYFTFSKKKKLI